ncbi:MAG: integrase family protein [Proteobacteria bacterium]|nr:integrase family protein [Pseudomonadota bacterium]
MPRPRTDGVAPRKVRRVHLNGRFIKAAKPQVERISIYDSEVRHLALQIEPSGHKSFKLHYVFKKRRRTFHLGEVSTFKDADAARAEAHDLQVLIRQGKDPQAEKQAERDTGLYRDHVAAYLAHQQNAAPKSFTQKRRYLEQTLTEWGSLPTVDISRTEVKALFRRQTKKSPSVANMLLAHLSGLFSWLINEDRAKMENPCKNIPRNEMRSRERVLSDDEVRKFWATLGTIDPLQARALKAMLLLGQRSSEIAHMRREHISHVTLKLPDAVRARLKAVGQPAPEKVAGFLWSLPGAFSADWDAFTRQGSWCGTKSGQSHEVWIPPSLADLLGEGDEGFVFAKASGGPVDGLPAAMKAVCKAMGIKAPDKISPHDLRRSHATSVTGLGFSVEQMHRLQNRKEGGVTEIYDRHHYRPEFWEISSAVVKHLTALAAPKDSAETKGLQTVA